MREITRIEGASIRPPGAASVVRLVHEAMRAEDLPYVIVGAAGRDIVLEHIYHQRSPSATRDVDFAVMVPDWTVYDALRTRLIESYGFATTAWAYRLRAPQGLLIDLVPFGGIEEPEGEVSLPPRHTHVMVTLGFAEAHEHALLVEIDGVGPIRVASLAAMSFLKLLAWRDRREARDAEDFALLVGEYYDLIGEAVYLHHADLFDEDDFDTRTASARMLGRDAGALATGSEQLQEALIALLSEQLDDAQRRSPLAIAMTGRTIRDYDDSMRYLSAYLRGFRERIQQRRSR